MGTAIAIITAVAELIPAVTKGIDLASSQS